MYRGDPAEHRRVTHDHVSRKLRTVRECRVVADQTVVGDVDVGEHQVAVADRRRPAIQGCPGVDRHVLADHVAVADDGRGRLAAVLAVLGDLADRAELEDPIARTDCRVPRHHRVRADHRACADPDVRTDDRERANLDVGSELRRRIDQRGGMDPRHVSCPSRRRRDCVAPPSARPRRRLRRRRARAPRACPRRAPAGSSPTRA